MSSNFKLMLITNDTGIAKHAVNSKVDRIFVDLEVIGKYERQGHLDTVISKHSIQDISNLRTGLVNTELLVRINPIHDRSKIEVEQVIDAGADIIMLPMFNSAEDIEFIGKFINHRVKFIPLIETKNAAQNINDYVGSEYVTEFYIGLNDLHRDLGCNFMFEPLANGYVEALAKTIKRAGKSFGFGGISRIGDGDLPAHLILAEHVRLGSSSVILSRAFHNRSKNLTELTSFINLELEVDKLHKELESLKQRSDSKVNEDKERLIKIVKKLGGAI